LDYLQGLGIGGIWINPIFPSGGLDGGYDVTSYVDIDPIYGTMDDFDTLVSKAHEMNISVVLDLIPNHTSDKHNWFIQSSQNNSDSNPYRDYYVWSNSTDKTKPPNNWVSYFGGSAWKFDETRQQWYYHSFLAQQPDLNFRNKQVQDEINASFKFRFREVFCLQIP
jgi:alpha-glucosidase